MLRFLHSGKFYLIQSKVGGSLSTEHGDRDFDTTGLGVDFLDHAGVVGEVAAGDADEVSHFVVDFDGGRHFCLFVFDAEVRDFLVSQGNRLALRAYETGDTAGVADDIPGIV